MARQARAEGELNQASSVGAAWGRLRVSAIRPGAVGMLVHGQVPTLQLAARTTSMSEVIWLAPAEDHASSLGGIHSF